jgi:general stress protein YciG
MAKEDRGFASMDRAKQREIASKGGKAAHQKGTAHEWTSEEARDAGRKGGIASHQRRREQSAPQVESAVAMDRSSSGSSFGSSSDSSSSYSSGSSSSNSSRDSYGSERGSSSEPSMPSSEQEE